MHCIGYNDNDNVVIRYYNKKLNVYNENILLHMVILKVKLKANINLALTLYDPGGGGGFKSPPPLRFFALTHLILELYYCALLTFPKK